MVTTAADSFLEIDVTDKRYGEQSVLRDLRLRVGQGEVIGLIGASGCGKSTLLSIISGLDNDYAGSVRMDGIVRQGTGSEIGFIFQEPRLFPWLTVAQNVAFAHGTAASEASEAGVEDCLAEVGMAGYGDALPKQLSGGQAQRVAIARGLFTRPRVLLLDEPFSAVDAFTRMKLQELLLRVARQHALTILIVTHDIDEALYLSDRILLLANKGGSILSEYAPQWSAENGEDRSHHGSSARAQWKSKILHDLHAAHAL